MAIAEETFRRARKYNPSALKELLAKPYPVIFRLAHALAGQEKLARNIVDAVMTRAVRAMPSWRDGDMAERWFYHHTILVARNIVRQPPKPEKDLLVNDGQPPSPQYVAFIRSLRGLAEQPREAFLLVHGERMTVRFASVSMDCSTQATQQHLNLAEQTLSAVAGEEYEALKARLARAYAQFSPKPEWVEPAVNSYAARGLLPRKIKRILKLIVFAALVIGGYWAWKTYGHLLPIK